MLSDPPEGIRAVDKRRSLVLVALLVSVVALAAAIRQSMHDTLQFPGFDFRMSVVAARSLNAGFDPYRTRLQTDERGVAVQPAVARHAYNRLLYAPTLLCLHAALASLPYLTQRYAWLTGSWLALLGSLGILMRLQRSGAERLLLFVIGVWFFAVSDFWRRHLLEGKYYALLMLLMTAGSWLVMRRCRRSWWAGVPFGLAAALRPTIAITALVLWVTGRRPAAGATLLVALAGSAASLLVVHPATWADAAVAVRVAEREMMYGWENAPPEFVHGPQTTEWNVDARFPGAGAEVSAVPFRNVVFATAVLRPLHEHLGWPKLVSWHLLSQAGAVIWIAVITGGLLLARPRQIPRRVVVLSIAVLILGIDFFLPERWTYNDVQYLLPLGLALPLLSHRSVPWWTVALVLVGLTLGNDRLMHTHATWVPEARMLGLLGGPTALAVWFCARRFRLRAPAQAPAPAPHANYEEMPEDATVSF
jgi:hypothetical protein